MVDKKSIFISIFVLVLLFISYRVVTTAINNTVDEANRKGVELYASSIKYAYTSYIYRNGTLDVNIDDLEIKITVQVNCEEKKLTSSGSVELYGCTVENSKIKYKYVNGRAERE